MIRMKLIERFIIFAHYADTSDIDDNGNLVGSVRATVFIQSASRRDRLISSALIARNKAFTIVSTAIIRRFCIL